MKTTTSDGMIHKAHLRSNGMLLPVRTGVDLGWRNEYSNGWHQLKYVDAHGYVIHHE